MVLATETAGPTTVAVYTMGNHVVSKLFDSRVDAGRWGFDWNGRLPDGSLAAPGIYRVEINRSGKITSRLVEIEKE